MLYCRKEVNTLDPGEVMGKCVLIVAVVVISAINAKKITINFSKQQLTEIPHNITSSMEILLLKSNKIKHVSATDLSLFASLTLLDLDYNGIEYLANGCFDTNERLEILRLSFNNIYHLPESLGPMTRNLRIITLSNSITENTTNFDFRPLQKIRWLGLRFIDIGTLGFNVLQYLPSNVKSLTMEGCSLDKFPALNRYIPTMQNIIMSHNKLTFLSLDSFENMTNINTLDITENALRTLPDLFNMLSLRELKLNGNPLECDKALCWLIMWSYLRTPGLTLDAAACQSPPQFSRELFMDLHPLDITCYEGKDRALSISRDQYLAKWSPKES